MTHHPRTVMWCRTCGHVSRYSAECLCVGMDLVTLDLVRPGGRGVVRAAVRFANGDNFADIHGAVQRMRARNKVRRKR